MRVQFWLLLPAIVLAACQPVDSSADPVPDAGAPSGALRLELSAEPLRGTAPLKVRFTARLLGELPPEAANFDCPTVAWVLDSRDDGQVVIAPAEGCVEGRTARVFTLDHRYEAARAFEAHVRLLAVDLPPSNTVQVLVQGPTPTPGPDVAQDGPTIILATAAPRATPPRAVTSVAGTLAAFRPQETPAAPGRAGRFAATAAPRILPADLYFLADSPTGLWRLPGSGRPMELLSPPDLGVITYAAGATGAVAFSSQRGLHLRLPGGGSAIVDPQPAQALVWSRDGRRLAYSDGRLRLLGLGDSRPRDLGIRGLPLGWSADGRWLLARGPARADDADEPDAAQRPDEDHLLAMDLSVDPPRILNLPLPIPAAVGWLPDRPALWLAGAGLQLLTLDDPLQVDRLLPPESRPQTVFARPDGRLLVLTAAADPGGRRLLAIDLRAGNGADGAPRIRPLARSVAAAGDWAIAPGGTLAARADETGLWLEDLVGGGEVPLLRLAASGPSWILSGR